MRGLRLQAALELRLLYKRRWPLLLPAAAGLWMLLQCLNGREIYDADINMIAASAHGQLMIFVTAVPILLGVLLIRRDTLNPSYEWSLGLPVTNRVVIASKWTAGFLYMSSFSAAILAVYLAAALNSGQPWASVTREMAWYGALYEMSFAAGVALGMLLGALMPLRFALPIAFCGWVFGSLFVPLLLVDSYGWYPLEAFSLNHLLNEEGSVASGVWTFPLAAGEYERLYLFVAAFTLFMLSATGALIARARPVLRPRGPLAFMALCLLLSAAAYVPYASLWMQRYDRLATMESAALPAQSAGPQEPYLFRIDAMRIEVNRRSSRLDMTAVLTLPTPAGKLVPAAPGVKEVRSHYDGEVSFLLDPLLKVQAVKIDGKSASWRRDGGFVSFPRTLLAGKDNHFIEFDYGGIIDEWMPGGINGTQPAFANGDNVLLPDQIGWYPIPGGESLKLTGYALSERYDVTAYLRADFDILLRGFDGPLFASIDEAPDSAPGRYHFAQRNAAAPLLFGGDFTEVRIGGLPIAVSTTPGNAAASRRFLENLQDVLGYYRDWSGRRLNDLRRIVLSPMSGQLTGNAGDGGFAQGSVYFFDTGRYPYSSPDSSRIREVLGELLFGDTTDIYTAVNDWEQYRNPQEQYSIVQEIRSAILSLYEIDGTGADDSSAIHADIPQDSPPARRMKAMIEAAYAEGRGDLVRRVLLDMLDRGLEIKDRYSRLAYTPVHDTGARFEYPAISWNDWLAAWNEEKGR